MGAVEDQGIGREKDMKKRKRKMWKKKRCGLKRGERKMVSEWMKRKPM